MRALRNKNGFSLFELVLVIALLALVASGTALFVGDNLDAQRYEETRLRMEAIRTAILGDNSVDSQGRRINFGYVGDWGSLPTTLGALTTAGTAWAYDTTYRVGAGWRGPYNTAKYTGASLTTDAWGTAFVWAVAGSVGTLTSRGSDLVAGGTGFAQDIAMSFPTAVYRGTVRGAVLSGSRGLNAKTVEIRYPVSGVLTAFTASSGASGQFTFNNVPFGIRSVRVSAPAPTLGPFLFAAENVQTVIPASTLNYKIGGPTLSAVCCRITLDAANPVTSANVTGTTLYLVPYNGSSIPIYDGTVWQPYDMPSAVSLTPAVAANTNYDVFACDDGAGNVAIETLAWASNTARATTLTVVDGILTKTSDSTRRYMGTVRTNAASQFEDSLTKRFVWNFNNRATRPLKVTEATVTWVYSTNTWRSANNSTANRVEILDGNPDAYLHLTVNVQGKNSASRNFNVGIAQDATNTDNSDSTGRSSNNDYATLEAVLNTYPALGYHYYQWTENGGGTATTTYQSNGGGGMFGTIDG